jgi:uncharacterized protein DUF3800
MPMARELVIYTDESEKNGRFFANFYGGALVRSDDLELVRERLQAAANRLGLTAEIKWQKVSSGYLDRYVALMSEFFRLVAEGRVKLRIMFTQKAYVPKSLTSEQRENEFFLLYYQFIKHAFGLAHCNAAGEETVRLRIYLDQLPDTREKAARFKGYLAALERSREFRSARVLVPPDQIAEVASHGHIVLQCLDVVLGAMQFRLNDGHRVKPEGGAPGKPHHREREALQTHQPTDPRDPPWLQHRNLHRDGRRSDDPLAAPVSPLAVRARRVRAGSKQDQETLRDPAAAMPRGAYPKWNLGLRGTAGSLIQSIFFPSFPRKVQRAHASMVQTLTVSIPSPAAAGRAGGGGRRRGPGRRR